MPCGLVPTWDELLVELPWLLFTWCCICQVWFLKHSVSPTYSLMLVCLEPNCACFLFTGLLGRKGEDRPDRNRQFNHTAVNNYVPTSTWCSDQKQKQTISEMPRSLTYSAQLASSKAVCLLLFVSRACFYCLVFLMFLVSNDHSSGICQGTRIHHSWLHAAALNFCLTAGLHRSVKTHLLCPFYLF